MRIDRKLCEPVVKRLSRTRHNGLTRRSFGSISVLICLSGILSLLFGGFSCLFGFSPLLLGSFSSCFFLFGLGIRISCDPCGGITERYDTRVVHTHFFALFLFLEKERHFLLVSFYKLLCETRLAFLAGNLFQVCHSRRSVEASYIFRLHKIDTAACFLLILGSVNDLIERRRYQCDVHNSLPTSA